MTQWFGELNKYFWKNVGLYRGEYFWLMISGFPWFLCKIQFTGLTVSENICKFGIPIHNDSKFYRLTSEIYKRNCLVRVWRKKICIVYENIVRLYFVNVFLPKFGLILFNYLHFYTLFFHGLESINS